MRLDVHRAGRRDERSDVGDRVPHPVAAAMPLEMQRLVKIARLGRVDRDERDVRLVVGRQARSLDHLDCVRQDRGGEVERDVEFTAQPGKRRADGRVVGFGEVKASLRHAVTSALHSSGRLLGRGADT